MTRPGAEALSLLATPLHVHTLKALRQGPMELPELHCAVGSPPQSTIRMYTRKLDDLGLLERRRRQQLPAATKYRITPAGESLLEVAALLQEWLGEAPAGPILLDSISGKSATKALVGGWSSSIMRALAARPISLTELNMLISGISYPSLERKVSAMRNAKLVERRTGHKRATPYGVTDWLRRAITPLTAAIAWEMRFLREQMAPITRIDVEAIFLLAIPLISLGPEVSGKCRLAVDVRGGPAPSYAGVLVCLEEGKVVSCSSNLEGHVQASASGLPAAWMRQMNGGPRGQLEVSGNRSLAGAVMEALRAIPKTPALNSNGRPR
jgi:DNA-binding HxlR family transcriptional regulator